METDLAERSTPEQAFGEMLHSSNNNTAEAAQAKGNPYSDSFRTSLHVPTVPAEASLVHADKRDDLARPTRSPGDDTWTFANDVTVGPQSDPRIFSWISRRYWLHHYRF
jgi:hypothetical protein